MIYTNTSTLYFEVNDEDIYGGELTIEIAPPPGGTASYTYPENIAWTRDIGPYGIEEFIISGLGIAEHSVILTPSDYDLVLRIYDDPGMQTRLCDADTFDSLTEYCFPTSDDGTIYVYVHNFEDVDETFILDIGY